MTTVTDTDRWGPCGCDVGEVGTHWKGCHLRPMEQTKADFVVAAEGGASAAIDTYRWCVEEGMSPEEAKEVVVAEAAEAAACWAGIGSCYGGGCKHG